MRVFLAVSCGERLAGTLATALDGLRAGPLGALDLRWTRPETWHLTLQFLGNWPQNRLDRLNGALAAAGDLPPFALRPGDLGGFPDLNRPRVLFLHLADDGQADGLAARVRDIVGRCWPDGPQDTRPFRRHLTLARIRERLSRQEVKLIQDIVLPDLPAMSVEGFSLVASHLSPAGPRYEILADFPLRK